MKKLFILVCIPLLFSCTTPSNSKSENNEIIEIIDDENEVSENNEDNNKETIEDNEENEDDNNEIIEDDNNKNEVSENNEDENEISENNENNDNKENEVSENNEIQITTFNVIFDCYENYTFSQIVEEGKTIVKPNNPIKEDYNFAYWYLEEDKEFDFNTIITSDITLKAKWYKTWCEIDDSDDFTTFEYYENNVKCVLTGVGNDMIGIGTTIDNEACYFFVKKVNNRITIELGIAGWRNVVDVNKFGNKIYFTTVHK
jgi:hypothetical protein